jgi:hypothetical protein
MNAGIIQIAAVLVVVATWGAAEAYSRWARNRAERAVGIKLTPFVQQPETMDASTISASDD